MLEGDVYTAEIIDLRPATGIIDRLFDAVQRFSANSRFCVGALEFTFDLLHRAVQWSIFGAGRNSITYATRACTMQTYGCPLLYKAFLATVRFCLFFFFLKKATAS